MADRKNTLLGRYIPPVDGVPDWAMEAAVDFVDSRDELCDSLAILLVKTREKALLEAVFAPVPLMDMTTNDGKWHAVGVGDKTSAILSLIDKEPAS